MVEEDVRWRRFIGMRFRAFVFVPEVEVSEALGPGPHDRAARVRARETIREKQVQIRIAAWLEEARLRAAVRRLDRRSQSTPDPFSTLVSDVADTGRSKPGDSIEGGY